ncbi:hypothetical protein ABZZ79_02950 [Streptomyces sp. NPDC006458]|uniref:hypothetical protein n=1 Tax=Streptomyces sp. NPDC006458 TaxID=3154302 RepID=UPI00339E41D6
MTNIAFVDCETTHLDASIGVAWEVAVILREFEDDQHTDTEYCWQIRPSLANADPEALAVGRFEERFAVPPGTEAAWTADESGHVAPMTRREAVTAIVNVLSGAVLVGSNPGFDDRHLRRLVGRGRAKWHYRPYDIVQLAATKIGAQTAGPLPWRAHVLSRAVGVEPPTEDVAHTALGDARWARDVYDAVMTREKIPLSWEGRAAHAIGLYTQPLETPSQPVVTGDDVFVPRTERSYWVDIADALNAAHVAGMPVGVDLDGTLTDHNAWSVIWDHETERWTVAGYDADLDEDQDDDEPEETGDADGDVFELISEIASRLSDATDEGEFHAVSLIGDLANGRKTIAETRAELAEITFRHV